MTRRLELLRLLETYVATPAESRDLAEMLALARSPHDVLSRYWFDPGHFTISGFVTDAAVSHLVLIHHGKLGAWLQPGGHIEPDDVTLAATLTREIEEETGLRDLTPASPALFDVDVHRIPAHGSEPAHRHFDLRFHLAAPMDDLAATDEVIGAAWVPLAEVASWTDDRSVRRAVAKLLAGG